LDNPETMTNLEDPIFLLSDGGTLQKVTRSEYDSEQWLQDLIDTYPELLAGEQIAPNEPLRWLVVGKEVGIPDSTEAADRWSLDILLIDNQCRPTLVEVKRSTDRRIRREVVGQMLDYAANSQLYWPVDKIRSLATERHGGAEKLDAEVGRLLAAATAPAPEDIEEFWAAVGENQRHGRVRLLFVADELPRELRRIIEFLNEHMPDIEVLGVEIPQYTGSSFTALVPRLIGQTELIRQGRQVSSKQTKTNEAAFFASFSPAVGDFFRALLARVDAEPGVVMEWGTRNAIIRIQPHSAPKAASVLYLTPPEPTRKQEATLEFYLGYLRPWLPDTSQP
jgi:hypothetical protein